LELTTGRQDPIISVSGHDSPDVAELLENDLEMVTASRFPIIRDIKESLLDAGAEGALMSGSGPSVFGVFRSRDRALSAERDLLSRNWGDTYVVEGITRHDWGAAESSETGLGGPQRES
jgi:4-diphosphocytidyl-2-C-methyl-D-erythritol kinase